MGNPRYNGNLFPGAHICARQKTPLRRGTRYGGSGHDITLYMSRFPEICTMAHMMLSESILIQIETEGSGPFNSGGQGLPVPFGTAALNIRLTRFRECSKTNQMEVRSS